MLYLGTTIASWILMSIASKAIYSRLDIEGYDYIKPKKTKAEERQEKATIIKWIVTGVCIVGSIVAIAATGGAATPLVVGEITQEPLRACWGEISIGFSGNFKETDTSAFSIKRFCDKVIFALLPTA